MLICLLDFLIGQARRVLANLPTGRASPVRIGDSPVLECSSKSPGAQRRGPHSPQFPGARRHAVALGHIGNN